MAGPIDDIVQDIKLNVIEKWDYSPLFPTTNTDGSAYIFPRGPIFVTGWAWQLDSQLQTIQFSQMEQPYISVLGLNFSDQDRTFADIYQANTGSGPLSLRLGRRAQPSVLVSCWANQQLGGMDMARKLAGYCYSAIFAYRNNLTTMRGLRVISSQESFVDASMLYRVDLTVTGRALLVTDV